MQVEDKEINGFLIDKFNQHGLEVGKTQGICPLCSSSRKPENKKAKCCSYDWERGLGTCHNCDSTFQLHTYKRKGKAEKVYTVPDLAFDEVNSKVIEWFKTRGISEKTLNNKLNQFMNIFSYIYSISFCNINVLEILKSVLLR